MKAEHRVGRIHKDAFAITTGCGLGLAVLGVVVRFIIRFHVQKQQIAIDDVLILLALSLLIASSTVMYHEVLDRMYQLSALQEGIDVEIPDLMEMSYQYHKFYTICLMLGWTSFNAIKFSFLFFFKRMIDRLPTWMIYWWIVVVYTTGVMAYGFATRYVSCPYFNDPRELLCTIGSDKQTIVLHTAVNIALDIVGDLLILAIPIAIIWNIRVHWTKKIVLVCSLCLTVVIIVFVITQASGLVHQGAVDINWLIFWHVLNSEAAVFLASAVSFRSFFVSRKNSRPYVHQYSVKRVVKESIVRTRPSNAPDSPPMGISHGGDSHGSLAELDRLSRAPKQGSGPISRNDSGCPLDGDVASLD